MAKALTRGRLSPRRRTITKKGTTTENSLSPILKWMRMIILTCLSLTLLYRTVVMMGPWSNFVRIQDDASIAITTTATTSNAPMRMVQYLDPDAVQEAKRVQDDFCKSMQENSQFAVKEIIPDKFRPGQLGFRMHLYPYQDIVSGSIMKRGSWEAAITIDMIKNIEIYAKEKQVSFTDLTFVDIGANVGWYTMTMASLGLNVIAFEPMATNLELLRRDLCVAPPAIKDRVTLFGYGLSDKEQTCFQFVAKYNTGNGITRCDIEQEDQDVKDLNMRTHRVNGKSQLRVLDNIIRTVPTAELGKEKALNFAALKIDTEGFEPIVFSGGRAFLSNANIPIVFAEYIPQLFEETSGITGLNYLKLFFDNGYAVYNKPDNAHPLTIIPNATVAQVYKWPGQSDIVLVHQSFIALSTLADITTLPPNFVADAGRAAAA